MHGGALPHRGQIDYLQKTEISIFANNEAAADRAQHLTDISGKTGDGTGATIPVASTIISRNNDPGSTLPTEDGFTFKATLQPSQIWNVRGYAPVGGSPGAKSIARVLVEQTNW